MKAVLTSTHNLCCEQKIWKLSEYFIWKFSFFGGKILKIFENACFRYGYFKPQPALIITAS